MERTVDTVIGRWENLNYENNEISGTKDQGTCREARASVSYSQTGMIEAL